MSRNNSPALAAGGNIYPSRFLKLSTSADHTALQADANAEIIGISGPGVIDVREDAANAYHATATYFANLEVLSYGDADVRLEAGTGGWTAGDKLESDADGKGVTANGPGRNVGAIALETISAGEIGRVQIVPQKTEGDGPIVAASDDGAITAKTGTVAITKTSAAALTIAAPTATTDDGKTLTVFAATGFAHTVTFGTVGFNSSGTAQDVATFAAHKGNSITLKAYQGVWYAINLQGVTLG